MSVYTEVSAAELRDFLDAYALGSLVRHAGIPAGIENTNYFVTTSQGEYVLTLFEATPAADLPFFLDLMAHLAEHGVPSAHPLADRDGRYLNALNGRPAALVQRLAGRSVEAPDTAHCAAIGAALARMHLAVADFAARRESDRGPAWRDAAAARLRGRLPPDESALLERTLEEQRALAPASLPGGVIHADLFRDNALFEATRVTGIIDFYYACNGPFVYDVAVTVADWCCAAGDRFDPSRASALLGAYHAERPFEAAERDAWPRELRAAGLRFWLSRLVDQHFPREGMLTQVKDPEPFRRVVLAAEDEAAVCAVFPPALGPPARRPRQEKSGSKKKGPPRGGP